MKQLSRLARRILPGSWSDRLRFECEPGVGERYEVVPEADGSIRFTGTGELVLAVALHRFLREAGGAHFSWCGSRLPSGELPRLTRSFHGELPLPLRPYLNYCTFGYSAAWWDWARWEREVDFMALNGINLPLAATGIEAVWEQTFLRLGVSEQGVRDFLSGPAFLPWQWMDNLDGHAGPLPQSWIDSHAELGRAIIDRERAWGMTPILPGFSGHVPAEFAARHPEAASLPASEWCGFPSVAVLSPADPLFADVMRVYFEELHRLFGRSRYYAIDLFHERALPTRDPRELGKIAAGVAATLLELVPDAVWVMQAWTENEHIIRAIPEGHLLILDIGKERLQATGGLYGVPTVWGTIHSFGGQTEIGGSLEAIPTALNSARQFSNLVGAGAFPESIDNNPVLFELVFDSALSPEPIVVRPWVEAYLTRRYGCRAESAVTAWRTLLHDVYTARRGDPLLAARPRLYPDRANAWAGFQAADEPGRFFPAWEQLLAAADVCGGSDGYRFDVIDLGRQALSSLGIPLFEACRDAFLARDGKRFATRVSTFLRWLADCDALLGTRPEFRLDRMIAEARRWGKSPEEADLYEKNVRLQLTLWGPEPFPQPLFDYCAREWNGLIAGYYLPRWKKFFSHLAGILARGERYDETALALSDNRPELEANPFYCELFTFEQAWVNSVEPVPAAPLADELVLARRMLARYRSIWHSSSSSVAEVRPGGDLLTAFQVKELNPEELFV